MDIFKRFLNSFHSIDVKVVTFGYGLLQIQLSKHKRRGVSWRYKKARDLSGYMAILQRQYIGSGTNKSIEELCIIW